MTVSIWLQSSLCFEICKQCKCSLDPLVLIKITWTYSGKTIGHDFGPSRLIIIITMSIFLRESKCFHKMYSNFTRLLTGEPRIFTNVVFVLSWRVINFLKYKPQVPQDRNTVCSWVVSGPVRVHSVETQVASPEICVSSKPYLTITSLVPLLPFQWPCRSLLLWPNVSPTSTSVPLRNSLPVRPAPYDLLVWLCKFEKVFTRGLFVRGTSLSNF